ncbi:hypothetical protein AAKU52_002479 [Pedobacter sp. CG_S7]|uniref:baeRF3 domain-containing protein n=1 Tax=Pedobacter sp. CG_S7 TaxID=3143930 RepID=UPI0033930016
MNLLNKHLVQELLLVNEDPCLSLYMPTHRSHPENLQDPIKFKNLVKQLEESLLKQYSSKEVAKILEPIEELGNNSSFWNHVTDGLAVFSSPSLFKTINLQVPVEKLAIVANSMHTKPLRKYLQSLDRYQVLGLSLNDIKLFEGNRHSLIEVKIPSDFPTTIEAVLGDKLTEKHSTVASYGGAGGDSSKMHHGHGGKKDEVDVDSERFFRVVATNVYEKYSKPSGLPLILAALPEHHNLFHKVSNNHLLLENGIHANYKAISIDKLTTMSWEVIEPAYILKLKGLVEDFEQAKANKIGSDNIKDVAKAVAEGKVGTLLLESDRIIAGKITNKDTGAIQTTAVIDPKVDDLLDDIGELVTQLGGQVFIVPKIYMPSETGIAAIFRY